MKKKIICESCGQREATQRHHKLPQRNEYRKLYGTLLDDPRAIQEVCDYCGSSHGGQGKGLIIWTENEFCDALNIEPRSKTARAKKLFNK